MFGRLRIYVLLPLMLLLSLRSASAASVLSICMPGASSHLLNLLRIGRELNQRGHGFDVLVSKEDHILHSLLESRWFDGLKVIKYDGPLGMGTEALGASLSRDLTSVKQLLQSHKAAAHHISADQSTLSSLKATGYDLLMRDASFWPGAVLQDILNISSVEVLAVPVLLPWTWEVEQSIPNPVAYVPQFGTVFTPNMILLKRLVKAKQQEFVTESSRSYKTFETGTSTAAAVIVVTDWALQIPQPMPPRVHLVGSVLAEDAKPLPAELDAFLNQGLAANQGQGAVLASLGTLALLTEHEVRSIAQGLCALDTHVLWKLDAQRLPGNMTLESLHLTAKVKLMAWVPQNDVLGHPAVKAFLSHAGINSIYEAAYHAVPIVSVPLIGDQVNNAVLTEYHGFGVTVSPNKLSPVSGKPIQEALTKIMSDSAFQANADKASRRLQNKPRHPAQLAADIVERVLATDGDMYLETAQHTLSWWQLSLLDVKAFLFVVALLAVGVLGVIGYGVYFLLSCLMRSLWLRNATYGHNGKRKAA